MTTVYLVRHAQAEGNYYRRAQGHYNGSPTELGYRQIAALARRFENTHFDAVYASDLARTNATALSVYWTHGLPLHTDPAFREVGIGVWENKPWAHIQLLDPESLTRFNTDCTHFRVEGGETIPAARDRFMAGLRRVIAAHPNGTVAIFAHGIVLRMVIGTLQGLTDDEINRTGHVENTSVTKLEAENGAIRVLYRDDASHLGAELISTRTQAWTRDPRGFESGTWYEPNGRGGFTARSTEGELIGTVALGGIEGRTAILGELRLEESARGKNLALRLIGQAIAAAREQGCDTLRCTVARDNARGAQLALRDGFVPVGETAEGVVYEKFFDYTEEYGIKKLQEVMGK